MTRRLTTQEQAEAVAHLLDMGCHDGALVSVESIYPERDTWGRTKRRILRSLAVRFGCWLSDRDKEELGCDMRVSRELFIALDNWRDKQYRST